MLSERHQIGNFADFCNDCGNCDIFCPEDGGPYVIKPRFFGDETVWRRSVSLDGFYLDADRMLARFEGSEYALVSTGDWRTFAGPDGAGGSFELTFDAGDPAGTIAGEGSAAIDLTYYFIMEYLRQVILDPGTTNYINSLLATEPAQ